MRRVLHLLPHAGGGAEKYLDLLEDLPGYEHTRTTLSAGRTPASAALSLPRRFPGLARAAQHADLVHVHGDAAAILTVPLPTRTPFVLTSHGLHLLRRRPAVAPAVRLALRRARVTLCTSAAERDELATLAPALRDRLVLARNGLPDAPPPDPAIRATVRDELGLAASDVAVLFLGELEERKGPGDAVAAVTAARAVGAPVVLLLAGDGPLREQLAAIADSGARVLGFRRDPERLLAGADVFVLPSAREGLSFAILEAMQAGLAPVVADGPGNPEAVGDAGIVVPAGDVPALTDALRRLAEDPAERDRLARAARARVAAEFSVAGLLDAVAAGYATALGDGPPA